MRTESEMRALLVLLGDEDEKVAGVAWSALLAEGEAAAPYLREASATASDTRVRGRARLLLDELALNILESQWAQYLEANDTWLELEKGCLLIGQLAGELDAKAIGRFLDAVSGMVRAHMVNTDPLTALNEVIFDNLGFRAGDLEDPASHYLHKVLERRSGIPISLATVYVLVGQRADLPVSGVAMPGHFVARFERTDGPVFVDCFNRGRMYNYDTLRSMLERRTGSFHEAYLKPTKARFMLFRMLNNLHRVYSDHGDSRMARLMDRFRDHLGSPVGE